MIGIKRQELTLVQAAELMDVSYRQSKRVWRGIGPTATPGWCTGCGAGPKPCGAKRRNCGRACWPATTSATGTSVRRWPPSIWRWTTLSRKRLNRRRSKAGRRNSACRNACAVSFDPIHFVPAWSHRSQRRRRKSRKNRAELRFSPVSFWTRVFPFFNCAWQPVQKRLLSQQPRLAAP